MRGSLFVRWRCGTDKRHNALSSLKPRGCSTRRPPRYFPRRPTLCASAVGGVSPPGGLLAGLTRETPLCAGFFALRGGPPFTLWGSDSANRPSCCLQRTWSLAIAFGSFLRLGGSLSPCQGSPTTAFASSSRSLTSFPLPIPSRVLPFITLYLHLYQIRIARLFFPLSTHLVW